jgi:hypothetical protein
MQAPASESLIKDAIGRFRPVLPGEILPLEPLTARR